MISFIKKLFSANNKNIVLSDFNSNKKSIIEKEEISSLNDDLVKQFLDKELEKVDYFLSDRKDIILKHIKSEIDLNKSNDFLTKEEKINIGINTRLKITKKLISIYDTSKLKEKNPKELLKELYFRINFKITKIEDIKRLKKSNIKKAELLSCGDVATCDWCLSMDNKIIDLTKTDLIKLIDDNCKCEYNRSSILAVFDD